MTYRFTFYKIPFSETGVEYPLPTVGNPTASLASYKTAEQLTTAAFRENQSNIVFSEPDTDVANGILKSNYMRVGVVVAPGTIDTDENVAFYWVRDVECLGGVAIPPLNVTIAPDDIMTEFFSSNSAKISGRMIRCSKLFFDSRVALPRKGFLYNVSCDRFPYPYNRYGTEIKQSPGFTITGASTSYQVALICSLTKNDGSVSNYCKILKYSDTFSKELWYISNAYKIKDKTEEEQNISVLNIYVLHENIVRLWLDKMPQQSVQNVTLFTKMQDGSEHQTQMITLSWYASTGSTIFSSRFYIFPENDADFDFTDQLYICTPNRFIKYDNLVSSALSVELYFAVGSYTADEYSSIGEEGFNLYLRIENEIYDITDDYKVSFAVNEKAINQAQFQGSTALSAIGSVIGSIGGTIGGVMSGNYFGAVQSVAGGFEGITSMQDAKKTPGSIKSQGAAGCNWGAVGAGIGYLLIKQSQQTDTLASKVGYIYTEAPFVEFTSDEITDDFYKFQTCDAVNLSGGGQDAQATIEALFTRGVRFKAL